MRCARRWTWLVVLPLLTGCQEWNAARDWITRLASGPGRPVDIRWVSDTTSAWAWRQWFFFQEWLKARMPDVPLRFQSQWEVETTLAPRLEMVFRRLQVQDLPVSELRWRWERPSLGALLSPAGLDAFYDQRWPIEVVLGEADLEAYLRTRAPELGQVKVHLQDGRLVAETTVTVLGLPVPARLQGRLAWEESSRLVLTDPGATLGDQNAPSSWLEPYLKQINPVFDSGRDLKLPFPLEWDGVRIEAGKLRLGGAMRLRARVPQQTIPQGDAKKP